MSDDTKWYTEREMVMAKRGAFREGARYQRIALCHGDATGYADTLAEQEAAIRLPLPRVTRPRVVRDGEDVCGSFDWSVRDGQMKQRTVGGVGWYGATSGYMGRFEPTSARVALWADLLAHPTEDVPEDEDA